MEQNQQQQINEVEVIHNSTKVLADMPAVLLRNRDRASKAEKVGIILVTQWEEAQKIIDEAERVAVMAEIDVNSNKYLANVRTARDSIKKDREPYTQLFDMLRGFYTACENRLDPAGKDTIPSKVQVYRNSYGNFARDYAERQRELQRRETARKQQLIDAATWITKWLAEKCLTVLADQKKAYTNSFNQITLETFDEKSEKIRNLTTRIPLQTLQQKIGQVPYDQMSRLQFSDITRDDIDALPTYEQYPFELFIDETWVPQLDDMKISMIDKLPSKKAELVEAKRVADEMEAQRLENIKLENERQEQLKAAKNEAEKKRIEREQAQAAEAEQLRLKNLQDEHNRMELARLQREQEEQDRINNEKTAGMQSEFTKADVAAQGAQTMAMFEGEAAVVASEAPSGRTGLEIVIANPAAVVEIFTLWFMHEGAKLPIEKILATKVDSMKTWAEKFANKKGGTKIESKFLSYRETFKATNRRAS